MNVLEDSGVMRQRWSARYAALLATLVGVDTFLALNLIRWGGRGWQVAIMVQMCFVIIFVIASVMAAESLAWRLDRGSRTGLAVATGIGGGLLTAGLILLHMNAGSWVLGTFL